MTDANGPFQRRATPPPAPSRKEEEERAALLQSPLPSREGIGRGGNWRSAINTDHWYERAVQLSLKLLGNLNLLLAAALFGLGYLFLRYPQLTGDLSASAPEAAATLVGALWGSGALLFGAYVNEKIQRGVAQDEIRRKRGITTHILRVQFIEICRSLFSLSQVILLYLRHELQSGPKHFNYTVFMPPRFVFADVILTEISCLDERDVALILNFHLGVEGARDELQLWSMKTGSTIIEPVAFFLLQCLRKNFELARTLSDRMWPYEEILERNKYVPVKDRLRDELEKIRQTLQPN